MVQSNPNPRVNMHSDTNGPYSVLTDNSSLQVATYSPHGYADSVYTQTQNHVMGGLPLPFTHGGEPLQNLNPQELWNTQTVSGASYSYPQISSSSHQDILGIPLPFDCLKSAVPSNSFCVSNPGSLLLESTNYSSLHKGDQHASCSSNSLSLNFNSNDAVPYSPPLSGSRYLPAMQEILAEIACFTLENFDQTSYSATVVDSAVSFPRSGPQNMLLQEREAEAKKKHLMSLLQVVDEQYSQCLDEIHTVVSAFHAVTELDPNLHARFALPTISLMYKNLRERISHRILAMGANVDERETCQPNSFEASFMQKQWSLLKKKDHHQLWKPQRGLPERSVSVLRQWMFQNFLHPYPKDAEKHLLAMKSGLTRSQVSNWFINARVRLWKPMIEEMYAEMNRRKARRNGEESNDGSTQRNHHLSFENRRYTMN